MNEIKQRIFLDVGCGFNKQYGWIGMDKRAVDGVDIVHDAEVTPWPLKDESCAVIQMSHLIEHIKPWFQIDVINECWRVLEPDGKLCIVTPYATSFGYAQDPTHCTPWNEATPSYFIADSSCEHYSEVLYNIYRPKPWKEERLYWNTKANLELILGKISENGEAEK